MVGRKSVHVFSHHHHHHHMYNLRKKKQTKILGYSDTCRNAKTQKIAKKLKHTQTQRVRPYATPFHLIYKDLYICGVIYSICVYIYTHV